MAKVSRRGVVRINLESVVFAPIMFVISLVATFTAALLLAWEISSGRWSNAALLGVGLGAFLCYASWHAWRRGASHLLVDVPGGVVYAISNGKPWTCGLDKLGPLQFEAYRKPVRRFHLDRYRLRVPGFDNGILIDDFDEKKVREFQTTLEGLMAVSSVRKLLQTRTADMGAFRSGLDVHEEVRRLVPEPHRLRVALIALANDVDPDIRTRALELRAGLERSDPTVT